MTLPRTRWLTRSVAAAMALALVLAVGACDTDPLDPRDDTPVVGPGETLPLAMTVRVEAAGNYLLPAAATSLRTRCWGRVTVSFEPPAGPAMSNTCETDPPDGSANQTNGVTGVTEVTYSFGPNAFAHVTVN